MPDAAEMAMPEAQAPRFPNLLRHPGEGLDPSIREAEAFGSKTPIRHMHLSATAPLMPKKVDPGLRRDDESVGDGERGPKQA